MKMDKRFAHKAVTRIAKDFVIKQTLTTNQKRCMCGGMAAVCAYLIYKTGEA